MPHSDCWQTNIMITIYVLVPVKTVPVDRYVTCTLLTKQCDSLEIPAIVILV